MKDHTTLEYGERILARGDTHKGYAVRLASCAEEVRAAQTLRFVVFNLELNEGLEASYATCRDEDPFDAICDHLIVEDLRTNDIVGTYRLQTGLRAAANRGYYSAQEFDLRPLEPLRSDLVELGRACVHSQHRNLVVLGLLWKGIAAYARERGCRYLMGCSSLTSQDPRVGATMYSDLARRHVVPVEQRVQPLARVACPMNELLEESPRVPKLLLAYLSIGAKICGPPAIDREFKTIDFLTLLDLATLPPETVRRYLN
ncbi:MAG: GNAT family N-acyltransferase [Verrucomicrobiota bacterium]